MTHHRGHAVAIEHAKVLTDLKCDGEIEVGRVVLYAREDVSRFAQSPLITCDSPMLFDSQMHLSMSCITVGESSLTRLPGGVAYQLMQLQNDTLMVMLEVVVDDSTVERHTVALLTDFEMPTHPTHRGAIIDNDPRIPIRMLDDSDRTKDGARKVFDSLFWTARHVRISSVWRLAKPQQ